MSSSIVTLIIVGAIGVGAYFAWTQCWGGICKIGQDQSKIQQDDTLATALDKLTKDVNAGSDLPATAKNHTGPFGPRASKSAVTERKKARTIGITKAGDSICPQGYKHVNTGNSIGSCVANFAMASMATHTLTGSRMSIG